MPKISLLNAILGGICVYATIDCKNRGNEKISEIKDAIKQLDEYEKYAEETAKARAAGGGDKLPKEGTSTGSSGSQRPGSSEGLTARG